jgi:threonine/homoserine/homoserine lactone efflux protein
MSTPGPFQAYLLGQTLQHGWKRTLPATLAPLVSDGPIVFLVLLVLTQTPTWFLDVLRLVGGFFLLYLAKGALSGIKSTQAIPLTTATMSRRDFFKAVLLNSLSPGPYIFWSTIAGPIVLSAWRQAPGLAVSFVLGFYVTLIGGFMLFVILFATASQFGPKVSYFLRVISVLALILFGLYQIWLGATALIGYFWFLKRI